ncbi:hypothetical protein Pint_17192 [Pistacia integerrima]|uniref:Uncharacterized protein n=1 Tax=Pistacia integerrima TaxID=434235 RepID=A0ACC0YVX8_9ROSI|nr:hypothetical protein Pint_17192 [Pistacia integerrima]
MPIIWTRDVELDWVEPSLHLSNSRMLQPYGPDRVYDAFHLLQTEPSIQRMVVSLSSDQAVWKAVLNNEGGSGTEGVFLCSSLPDDETPTTGSKTAGATDPFEEKLRTSFLLSVMVLLVVVVTRAGRA